MSRHAIEATLDQLRGAETMMARMLNVLEGMQQEREVATLLSDSVGVMSRLMGDMLAERDKLIDEVVACREALRQRDALVAHGNDLLAKVTELREANRDLSERLRDAVGRLDAADRRQRDAEARLQEAQSRQPGAPPPESLPLVNIPPEGAALKDIEFEAIVQALTRSYMLQNRAAALLGISERVMSYKCTHVYRDRLKERGIICRGGRAEDEGATADRPGPDGSATPEVPPPDVAASQP